MNIFQIVLLNVVLLLFPLLIYLIYLSTNKSINKKTKSLYISFALITSFFLIIEYGINIEIMPILILNSLVILSYIENKVILANIFSLETETNVSKSCINHYFRKIKELVNRDKSKNNI